jgi:hypothetical protein
LLLKKITIQNETPDVVSKSSQGAAVPADSETFTLTEVKSVKKSEKLRPKVVDPDTIKKIVRDGKRFGNTPKPKTLLKTHLTLLVEENSFMEG